MTIKEAMRETVRKFGPSLRFEGDGNSVYCHPKKLESKLEYESEKSKRKNWLMMKVDNGLA